MSQVRIIRGSESYIASAGGKRFVRPIVNENIDKEPPVSPVDDKSPVVIDDETLERKLAEALDLNNDVEPIGDESNLLVDMINTAFNEDDSDDIEKAIEEEWSKK